LKRVAFLFPGQGSQYVGMGRELYEHFRVAREVFEEADESLGFSISTLCFHGPEEVLRLTENTQPAILTVSIAALKVLKEETEIEPRFVAGHSLGEYSALVASGTLSFREAVKIVKLRGKFMQEAVPVGEGAMAAILGMEKEEVEQLCKEAAEEEILTPANFNSPGQIVISGHTSAVQRAIEIAKKKGKKAILLPVSAPFHSPLMKPAALRLGEALEEISVNGLTIPVVTNVEARPNLNPEKVKPLLIDQISSPVQWEQSMRYMIAEGVEEMVEIGPGKVLSGLMKRIDSSILVRNIGDLESLKKITGRG